MAVAFKAVTMGPLFARVSRPSIRTLLTSSPNHAAAATATTTSSSSVPAVGGQHTKKVVALSHDEELTALPPLMPTGEVTIYEHPDRDLVNFPRPQQPLYGGRTRMGFIPEEWFDFFYKKTGVSGPYVFGAGLITTLLSKEIWVVEHEFPLIPPMIFLIWLAMTKGGPKLSAYLDKEIDKSEEELIKVQEDNIIHVQEQIQEEEKAQWMAKGQSMLFEAKRENVALQLEAEYRRRQMEVYRDIKKRLDYQVEIQSARRSVERRHMINWIINNVLKSIDEKQEKQNLDQCINNLSKLATA
ncbi:hypothetical protein RvY_12068 [Ramazzottius varieornatus]|uniref:ATP synthase subunit b n=1 Tax=Ramazzottius varieornatus TaxID=947166 RepID=A0A1D1VIA0_RAMVA|nr:hypothetical protein RvY_12068 [Ramazzottius varieornatus]